ncbi:UNVERIFIED_CONTAM: hypothetical protein NCL1_33334 [Trichonephila clavipes]
MSKNGLKQISQEITVFNVGKYRNYVEFLSKEMPDIKIDDNGLLENQHAAKLVKEWVQLLKPFQKNKHIPYENVIILVESALCCPGN